jgi:5-methylcytosine-specific restriction protein B
MAVDLATALRDARAQAPEGKVVVRIHLFGIRYAEQLRGVDVKALCARADVPLTYATEINKAMRLADYVTIKPGF